MKYEIVATKGTDVLTIDIKVMGTEGESSADFYATMLIRDTYKKLGWSVQVCTVETHRAKVGAMGIY